MHSALDLKVLAGSDHHRPHGAVGITDVRIAGRVVGVIVGELHAEMGQLSSRVRPAEAVPACQRPPPSVRSPDSCSNAAATWAADGPACSCSHSTSPGSTDPDLVAITRPSSGVKPIVVSTDRPSATAQSEAPAPKWHTTTRSPVVGRPTICHCRQTRLCRGDRVDARQRLGLVQGSQIAEAAQRRQDVVVQNGRFGEVGSSMHDFGGRPRASSSS